MELIEKLAATGTGAAKLAIVEEILNTKPASDAEFVAACRQQLNAVTVAKIEAILSEKTEEKIETPTVAATPTRQHRSGKRNN